MSNQISAARLRYEATQLAKEVVQMMRFDLARGFHRRETLFAIEKLLDMVDVTNSAVLEFFEYLDIFLLSLAPKRNSEADPCCKQR